MIKISVVIPTHNRKELLKICLLSLFKQTYLQENFEILVCDDGSTDGTGHFVQDLLKNHKNLRYLKQVNNGPASARNLGIKNSQGVIVAFTDDDCLPAKDWLEKIDQAFKRNTTAFGVEGKTIPDKLSTDLFTYQLINDAGGKYWTCNIAYRKKSLLDTGGFDERFFRHEDTDLAQRILKQGKVIFNPVISVVHPIKKGGLFSGLEKLSHLEDDFLLYRKHGHYLGQSFPVKNELAVFFLITFTHHALYRIRLLRASLKFFLRNPPVWFKFLIKNLLEIVWITFVFPWAVWKISRE